MFVNGLPLAVIKLKNPADENATIWSAFQQLQTYQAQIPALFTTNAVLITSDGIQAWIGAIGAGREWFKPWRTVAGEGDAPAYLSELQVLLEGVLEPRRFLDLLRFFIVFEEGDSRLPNFEEATEGEEVEHKEKLKSKWAQMEALVGAPQRIEQLAADLVRHAAVEDLVMVEHPLHALGRQRQQLVGSVPESLSTEHGLLGEGTELVHLLFLPLPGPALDETPEGIPIVSLCAVLPVELGRVPPEVGVAVAGESGSGGERSSWPCVEIDGEELVGLGRLVASLVPGVGGHRRGSSTPLRVPIRNRRRSPGSQFARGSDSRATRARRATM
ncbi:MAG: type I restriction endonuclease [Cyanobacteriota bacterium]